MKKYLMILIGLILLVTITNEINAQEQLNIMNATLPNPRASFDCVDSPLTNKIYCFGGNPSTDQIFEYNPLIDNLVIKTSVYPAPVSGLDCVESSFNNKIYCFGGSNLNLITEYDPINDIILVKSASLPVPRRFFSCAENSVTHLIYCFGGDPLTNQIFEYNPMNDTLVIKNAVLPTPRDGLSCAENSVTHLIYCFGGDPLTNQIFEYNPMNDTLVIKNAVLPTPRDGLSCAENSVTHLIYCFGGEHAVGPSNFVDQILEYDSFNDVLIIKNATLPSSRFGLSCNENSINHFIYCFGGWRPVLYLDQILEYNSFNDSLAIKSLSLPLGRAFFPCTESSLNYRSYCFGGETPSLIDQIVEYDPLGNLPPVLSTIGNQIIDEGQTLLIQLNAIDPENQSLMFTTNAASVLPSLFTFTQTSNTTALFEWTPTFSDQGNYDVTFAVTDSAGGSDSETITIAVNQVNQPPELQPIGNHQVTENQQLIIQLVASDFDNDPLIFGASALSTLPNPFSFNSNTGLFQWTPDGFTSYGDYLVTFNVTDGQYTDEETIQINVNDAQTANLFYIGTPIAGNTINFILGDSAAQSQLYIFVLALGNDQPILLSDGRTIPLNADGGFFLSLGMPSSIGLSNSLGFFNPLGSVIVTWTIPNYIPSGLMIKAAYVSINPTMTIPQGIISISNPVTLITS